MQHIHITDASGCTIVNIDDGDGARLLPQGANARTCPQCELQTWRLTPLCMHCGHDRLARPRWLAIAGAGAAVATLVIFHPLIRG